MRFVPVPIVAGPSAGRRVLFSIWETRRRDFGAFARETGFAWEDGRVPFEQSPAHPAVLVSWEGAAEFAAWLTRRERAAGKLGPRERYRLPTDHEWSCAVGIGATENVALSPAERGGEAIASGEASRMGSPWPGAGWPPPAGAGNVASVELLPFLPPEVLARMGGEGPGERREPTLSPGQAAELGPALETLRLGHSDGWAHSAPVGSFPADALGLHDLCGNVMEWCEDWHTPARGHRVLRGAHFLHSDRGQFLPAHRAYRRQGDGSETIGFRLVLAEE